MTMRNIHNLDRLIVALDVPSVEVASRIVAKLGDQVRFYKVGLELFLSGEIFHFLDWLLDRDKKIFVDLKLFDVPATVARAIKQLNGRGITFTTVHGNDSMIKAAVEAGSDVNILAVTALTSLDRGDLVDLGFQCDIDRLVLSRAARALDYGCAGIVASGQEAAIVRREVGEALVIVTPGIRPVENDDDQKRVVTVQDALYAGADYVVVGRPIRDSKNPFSAARSLQAEIITALDNVSQ
ncbi:MAG: orotidine-5'-phosphate decarboxylase [Acidiferrobacteraceae bacterium]|mgnify:CR=1 FL=1|nr:orotidine-5'-phosphate decarboxylase [Acidiferrobacteraceae bacterium]